MQLIHGKIDHPEVRIETTNKCNAHCVTCPREKMTREKLDMPFGHFISLANQAKDIGAKMVSVFGYGEPLMDPGIVDRIEYCTNIGLETFITTNAALLDVETTNGLVAAGLTHIRFSVHAIKSKDYEKIHRKLKAENTFRNIQNFLAINSKRGKCVTHVTCMPLNGESVEDFKNKWLDSVDHLEVWRPHNWASGRKFRQTDKPERVMCKRAFTGPIQILADGSMVLCCFDYDGVLSIGNTYQKTIRKLLANNAVLEKYRFRHINNDLNGLPCENCDQRFKYDESPLLFSSEQEDKSLNRTSITKTSLDGERTCGCGTNCG